MRLRQRRRQRHARKEGRAGDRRSDAVGAREEKKGIVFLLLLPRFGFDLRFHRADRTPPPCRSRSRALSEGERGVCQCVD